MTTIATLAVRLVADVADYTSKMKGASATAQQTANQISQNLKATGGSMMNVGKTMTSFVTLPILAAGTAALTYASNLEETKNKANVVFGSMAADVMAWSKSSDTAMGMSQQKALDAVSTFGAMGQAAGLNAKENLRWSESLVRLGSDWSSFYNLNPVDALNAIQSAVAGQYEPLRRMGVIINQATLEQKALQMGLMDEGGVLTDAARYQALYALMVDKSAAAQGDFARTADGVANQTRIVRAQFENAAATIGLQLLPYATQLLKWVSQAITWFQALTPAQQKWIVVILGIIAVVGPLIFLIGGLVTAIGAIIPVITAVGGALLTLAPYILVVAAVIGLLYLAWTQNWFGIQEKTAAVIAFVKKIIADGMQFIHDLTSGRLGWLSKLWKDNWEMIQQIIKIASANIRIIQRAWHALMTGDWHGFGQQMRFLWENIWAMIKIVLGQAWENMKTIIPKIIQGILNYFRNVNWADLGKKIIDGLGFGLMDALPYLLAIVKKIGQAVMEMWKGFFMIKSPSVKMETEVGWPLAAGAARGMERGMKSLMPGTMSAMMPAFGNVPSLAGAGVGAGMQAPIQVTVDYRPTISLADENEARFVLAPFIQDEIRKVQKR